MTRGEQLAELVRQQAVDDATVRLYPDPRAMREADLSSRTGDGSFNLDQLVGKRVAPPDARLIEEESYLNSGQAMMAPPVRVIGDGRVWTKNIIHYQAPHRCPVCKGQPLRRTHVCLCCHATAIDPEPHSMQESPKQAAKREQLAGGTGKGKAATPGKRGPRKLWADYLETGKV